MPRKRELLECYNTSILVLGIWDGGEFLTVRSVAKLLDTVMKQVKIEEENGDWTWVDFRNNVSVTD
ncbi:hypothetical protein [Brevibacillus laterosporus]|uniref:hypothetical protein n=1 Tax=Brevibacillus laterosporus TaxID=1465 RepID=UPI00264ED43B|nr:hypothetical protein [Brevibacillus laterosporus]MDN9008875.1 hypothetical protein [Brevibacillus laterosporus]MDO0940982.1 hypothetical protein [Brevibacillus laterosporus]